MTLIFGWLFDKAKGYVAAIATIAGIVLYAFLKGRASGAKSTTEAARRETDKINEKFRKIDSAPADFDAALNRLRKRQEGRKGP